MPHDTCRVYRPGVTLHRRIAPTAPCSATYEPGVTVIAQGRKRVDLGRTTFIYGESRYLLTSVDLPIVSQIIEASEEAPCLAISLKLEMPVIRELLSREEIQWLRRPLTVLPWRPVKPQWNSSVHAAGSWTCWTPRRTFPF